MITCDFCIIPIGTDGSGCSDYVATAVQVVKDSGLKYELTGMGTHIEARDYDELYPVIRDAQEAVFKLGVDRAYSIIKIDDRRDKSECGLNTKVDSVNCVLK